MCREPEILLLSIKQPRHSGKCAHSKGFPSLHSRISFLSVVNFTSLCLQVLLDVLWWWFVIFSYELTMELELPSFFHITQGVKELFTKVYSHKTEFEIERRKILLFIQLLKNQICYVSNLSVLLWQDFSTLSI